MSLMKINSMNKRTSSQAELPPRSETEQESDELDDSYRFEKEEEELQAEEQLQLFEELQDGLANMLDPDQVQAAQPQDVQMVQPQEVQAAQPQGVPVQPQAEEVKQASSTSLTRGRKKKLVKEIEDKWEEVSDNTVYNNASQYPFETPTTILPPTTSDEEIFLKFLDEDFWTNLTTETNSYYKKELEKSKTKQHIEQHTQARILRFKETNVEEMKAFIALYLYMGIDKRQSTEGNLKNCSYSKTLDYWDSDDLTTSFFPAIMSYRRFEDLNHFFQINNIEASDTPSIDKLAPLLSLAGKFREIYTPTDKISIDESICPFRGRFKHLVYEPKKPHK